MACPQYLLEFEGSANRQDHHNSTSSRKSEVTCQPIPRRHDRAAGLYSFRLSEPVGRSGRPSSLETRGPEPDPPTLSRSSLPCEPPPHPSWSSSHASWPRP